MLLTVVLAAALGVPPCWDIFDNALRHSAAAAHPAFVTYDERISVINDNRQLLYSTAHVDYRDDGTARVEDERFAFHPIVTRHAEPGPPELGPYGVDRASWFPQDAVQGGFPIIAQIRAQGNIKCEIAGLQTYRGHQTFHLAFRNLPPNRPNVKEIWIDRQSHDIWKLIVSGYVLFVDMRDSPPLTDFQVELSYAGQYLVVDHVVWTYRLHEYAQYSNYFGEYKLTGFEFPDSLPAGYFGESTP